MRAGRKGHPKGDRQAAPAADRPPRGDNWEGRAEAPRGDNREGQAEVREARPGEVGRVGRRGAGARSMLVGRTEGGRAVGRRVVVPRCCCPAGAAGAGAEAGRMATMGAPAGSRGDGRRLWWRVRRWR